MIPTSPLADEVQRARTGQELWTERAELHPGGMQGLLEEQGELWQRMLASARVGVRVHSEVLDKVLDDGRLMSQHESGTSSAVLDSEHRTQIERELFGDKAAGQHPIYGYVLGTVGRGRSSAPVRHYGDAVLVLRPAVHERATVLAFDSLGGLNQWRQAGEPAHGCPEAMSSVSHRSLVRPLPSGSTTLAEATRSHPVPFPFGYAEVQLHGGVALDQIERVAFEREPAPELAARLERLGLSWSVDPRIDHAPALGDLASASPAPSQSPKPVLGPGRSL